VGKQKAQGTKRETWFVQKARDAGFNARRWENNAEVCDVMVDVAGRQVPHEVKDVAALSLHPLLGKVVAVHGGDAAVVWHRKKKSSTGVGRTPAGPTLVAVTVDRYLALLDAERRAADAGV